MNKLFSMMIALVAVLFATNAMAWDPPPSPAPKSWISDPGHVLSDDAHARLDAKLRVINQSSANEMAALIVPTTDGENIVDVADHTFKSWGVGKKDIDNGVLVVLAMKEHKSHITTGKGVEGDLPDLKCSDVLQAMRPYLRSNDVEGALGYAFDQSSKLIANHKAEAAAAASRGTSTSTSSRNGGCQVSAPGSDVSVLPWVLALGGLGLLFWYLARRSAARSRARAAQLEAETEALLKSQRERQARLSAEREATRRAEEARLNIPTPAVAVPVVPSVPRPVTVPRPVAPSFPVTPGVGIAVAATAAVLAAEEETRRQHEAAARKRREQEEEAARRRRREQDEEDARRRRRDEESSSSSSSSSSSWDSGSSWSGGSDSGSGGFGGGDSGGGGASGDW